MSVGSKIRLITDEVRKTQIKSYAKWYIANLAASVYIFALVIIFDKDWSIQCVKKLSIWLIGVLAGLILDQIKKVLMMGFWWRADEPKQLEI